MRFVPREARQARNEVLFRELNERIAQTSGGTDFLIICECDTTGCEAMITVSIDDYRRVRSHPRRFFIFRGHNDPQIEEIVESDGAFQVVEKHKDVLVGR